MTRKLWRKSLSVILAMALLLPLLLGLPATATGELATELFYSEGFTVAAAQKLGEGKGVLFSGTAPAFFYLRENVTGDFSMRFVSVAEKAQIEFGNDLILCLSYANGKLTASVGGQQFTVAAQSEETLELTLSAEENILTLVVGGEKHSISVENFSYVDYRVTYRVTQVAVGAAKMCVYEINETSLAVPMVTNAKQSLYMHVTHDGVLGVDYELPQPYAFRITDGTSSDVYVTVVKDGKTVFPRQQWVSKQYFLTETAGTYTVILETNTKKKEYKINVRESVDESRIHVSEAFPFDTVGTGSKVTLPFVTYENDLYGSVAQKTQYVVYRDGVAIDSGVAAQKGQSFTFAQSGEYRFDYYSTEKYLSDHYSFCVTVDDSLPAICYEWDSSSCMVGENYKLPQVTITRNGEKLDAQTVLYFPSGQAVSNDVLLTEGGIYTLEFRAEKDGNLYCYSTEMLVQSKIHKTDNSAVYGSWTEGYFDQSVDGLLIELTDGKTYEYGNIIDLSDNNDPYASVLKFYVLPYTQGVADFTGLQITLTDAYDESNYVLIDFIQGGGVGDTYVRCRASNQSDLVGLEWWRDDYIKIHKNNPYGYYGLLSFTGDQNINYPGSYSKMQFDLCYDNSTMTLYGTHAWHSSGTVGLSREMTRLADTNLYKEAFGGFTTGEVRLSIKAYNFNSSKGRILITGIDGQDLQDETVTDDCPPILNVDTKGYAQDSLPRAVVGWEYPVFSAEAYDAQCGQVDVSVKAFFESNGRRYDVSITDGKFVPTWEGTYILQYSARDYYGNEAVCEYRIEAGERIPIMVDWIAPQTRADTGRFVDIALWSCGGGHGFVQMTTLSVQDENGDAVEIENGQFCPQRAGKYTVSCCFEDYIGQKSIISYVVKVSNSSDPILNVKPVLPMAFVDGGAYSLPLTKAEDYSTGTKKEVSPVIFVTDSTGKHQLSDGTYTATGKNGEYATVTYRYETENGVLEESFSVPIRNLRAEDGKLFDLKGLVVASQGEVVSVEDSDNYFVSATQDEQFFFAKPLLANGFNLSFNIGHKSTAGFVGGDLQSVRLILTDAQNRNQQIYIDIERRQDDNAGSYIRVNGGTAYVLNASFDGNTNYVFDISYSEETHCISDGSDLSLEVTTYADGSTFEGFSCGEVYATVQLLGVGKDGAMMELLSLCGQPFNCGSIRDRIAPNMTLAQPLRVCYSLGQTTLIPVAMVCDVLSVQSHVKISVQNPSGEYVTAADGTKLEMVDSKDYQIKLDRLGAYIVTFTVWDDNGAPAATVTRLLNVLDEEAPEISCNKDKLKAKVGEALNVNVFTASDNSGQEVSLYLFVQNAQGKLTAVNGNSHIFEETGSYRLVALAYDASGNLSRMDVAVEVGGA